MSKKIVLRLAMAIGMWSGLLFPISLAIMDSIPWSHAVVATCMFIMGAIIGIGLFTSFVDEGENGNSDSGTPSTAQR